MKKEDLKGNGNVSLRVNEGTVEQGVEGRVYKSCE